MKIKRILLTAIIAGVVCFGFASCANTDDISTVTETAEKNHDPEEKPYGYYKRVSLAKENETIDELKELLRIGKRGYLVVNEDGTAFFDLYGEKTEYIYDEKNFYSKDDTEMISGFPYVYYGGRLTLNEGIWISQFEMLTDKERDYYLKHGSE